MRVFSYCGLRSLLGALAAALLLCGNAARAQTPNLTEGVPPEAPLGETFCFATNFTNGGPPGYGPYLRLQLPPELSLESARLFGAGQTVTDLGVFPPTPGNEIEDPKTGTPVSGPEGDRLLLITLPIGTVLDGGPDLPLELCLTIDPGAAFAVPLPVGLTPVYQFGDTPTGANGPIVGDPVGQTVAPQVLFFDKASSVPEGERPPGPAWTYRYTLSVDIANGAAITPIRITDTLPADFQFDGTITFAGAGSCSASQLPSTVTPGGVLEVLCTGVPPGGLSDGEIVVSYDGYITDVLDAGTCASALIENEAFTEGEYRPAAGPVQTVQSDLARTAVSAQHLTLQQSVAPAQPQPGQAITYRADLQVTQFGAPDALSVVSILPDGIEFVQHGALTVNGVTVPATPTVSVNGDFTKTVRYEVLDAADAAGVVIGPGSALALTFEARVRFDYQATGQPLLAADTLEATARADYGLAGGAAGCGNDSAAAVGIEPFVITKELVNPQPVYRPGDTVVFRLTKVITAGSSSVIRFTDFLPLPVLDVDDLDLAFGSGDITRGPQDTAGLTPVSIVARSAQNALEITWPDLASTTPQTIQVDVAGRITSEPFADGLLLTNIFAASGSNTSAQASFEVDVDQIAIGAPELVLTKGVAATDGAGVIAPPPATLPVDGDVSGVDGNDQLTFLITVENTGDAPAHDVTISDPGAALLSGCTVAGVENGLGAALTTAGTLAGGLRLVAALGASDGSAGAPFGADTALVTVNCQVSATVPPASSFSNTASVTWASLPGATPFPPVSDAAAVTSAATDLQKLFVVSSEPGTSDLQTPPRAAIGEIVRYRLALRIPEGRIAELSLRDRLPGSLQFLDDGTATAAFVSNGAGVSSSTLPALPNVPGAAPDLAAIPSGAVSFPLPAGVISGGPFGPGADPRFALGDVINADSDDDAEFLLLELNALVVNVNGNNRDNRFAAFSGNTNLNGNSNAVRVRLAQPALAVTKTVVPATGDAGDAVSYTISISNGGGANVSPAYDVTLEDLLPPGLSGVANLAAGAGNGNCANLVIDDNSTAGALDFGFSEISPGCRVDVTFDSTLTSAVAPGTTVENVADLTWTSLPGSNGTTTNPTGSATPGAPGATDGERNGSGGVNSYSTQATAVVTIPGVGLVKRVSATDQAASGDAQHRAGVADLLIGERATFEITATLPEGQTPLFVLTDTLPFTNGIMRVESARVVSVGVNLQPDDLAPAPAVSDEQLGDGIEDTVRFDFGAVTNTPDGVTDAGDQVVVEVTGMLVDSALNVNADALSNSVLVQFGSGLDASATAPLDVVEPFLAVVKDGSISQGDAGDAVTFTVAIEHTGGSTADAQDLVLIDDLPFNLVLDPASIAVTAGPDFDVNTSSGNTVSLGWSELPLGESLEITYTATLRVTVTPGQSLVNTANLEWTSTPGDNPDERSNVAEDSHQVLVTVPGVDKAIFSTSEPGTGSGQFGPAEDLTIGETVTYRFTVRFPEGVSDNVVVVDQLPTGSSVLRLVSSQLLRRGSNLAGPGLPGIGGAGVASDSDGDGVDDRATWTLGNILNTPDGAETADDELEFEVVAVVLDLPANQSGDVDQQNAATVSSTATNASSTAAVDLVSPLLAMDKVVFQPRGGFVDGGDTVTMRLLVGHEAASTADAYGLVVEDTLPAGLNWIDDATVGGTCPGVSVDSVAAPLIRFSFDALTLAESDCFISYDVEVDPGVQPGEALQNVALLVYDSTPVFVSGETRRQTASAVAEVVVLAPTLVKLAVASSQPDTSLGQGDPTLLDLTIGETVTYELTVLLPEVLERNAVLVDTLPASAAGVLEVIGASVVSVGSQISTTLPGTPVLSDQALSDGLNDTVTIEFGDVSNVPDGLENEGDRIVVEVVARVVDLPQNVDGVVLTNSATFSSDVTTLSDTVDVEIVEPVTDLSKSMTLLPDGLVRISLVVENQGTAPVYDLQVNDVLDAAVWDVADLRILSVSPGFQLLSLPDTPAPGQTTLRLETVPGAVSPAGTIPVAGTASATFDVPLEVLPPSPNPVPNTATQDAADTLPGADPGARDLPPDTAEDTVALPDLPLLKTGALQSDGDVSGDVSPGDVLRYTLVLENRGAAPATALRITDVPDPNSVLDVGSVTTTSGTVVAGNGAGDTTVEVTIPDLPVGATVTIRYDTVLADPFPAAVDAVINQAVIDSRELPAGLSDDPTDPTSDRDPTVIPVQAQPDLVLAKDDGGASTVPGGAVTWTLSWENVGNQDATGVVLVDVVPANATFSPAGSSPGWVCTPDTQAGALCLLSLGTVPAGESGTRSFSVAVDPAVPAGVTEIVNLARVEDDGSNGPDPTPGDNQASDDTPLDAAPDLSIGKDDGGASAIPGQLVTWSLPVVNGGDQEATGVQVTDTVPANTVFAPAASTPGWACAPDNGPGSVCTLAIGALAPGGEVPLAFAVRVDNPLPAGVRELVNTASVGDDGLNGPDPTPGNNQATDTTPVAADIDLAISKTDGGVTATPGSTVIYTLGYRNLGTQGVTGVVVTETVPPNTRFAAASSSPGWSCAAGAPAGSVCTFTVGDFPSGASGTVLFAVTLAETLPETVTEIPNGASIADDGANGPDENPANNRADVVTPAEVQVALLLDKRLTSAPDPIRAGDVLEYTLTATNQGNAVLTGVVVSDSLITPTGGTTPCTRLAPAEACTLVGAYTVTQDDVDRGRIDNTGTAVSDQTAPQTAALSVPLTQAPGLLLSKTATLQDANDSGLGDLGETVDYLLVATNTGDTTLTDVMITDSRLAGLACAPSQPAVLVPGATLSCTGAYVITSPDRARPELVNTAQVQGTAPGGALLVDEATAAIPLAQRIVRPVPVLGPGALALLIGLMALMAAGGLRRTGRR